MRSPNMTQKEYEGKIDKVKKCGENRGPHDYIPISWTKVDNNENVSQLLCRVCFTRLNVSLIHDHFDDANFEYES
jgi:hypothetical protein